MPTNANTFNSRVTSEALEAKFREVFPAQGGAELVQDLFASGVIQPVIDFSSAAEGSVLGQNLQTAYDFATSEHEITSGTGIVTVANSPGFWLVWGALSFDAAQDVRIYIEDGTPTQKPILRLRSSGSVPDTMLQITPFVVYLRALDSLKATNSASGNFLYLYTRQIASVNGTLVNPLGFTFS